MPIPTMVNHNVDIPRIGTCTFIISLILPCPGGDDISTLINRILGIHYSDTMHQKDQHLSY